jgi:hypothetical protein
MTNPKWTNTQSVEQQNAAAGLRAVPAGSHRNPSGRTARPDDGSGVPLITQCSTAAGKTNSLRVVVAVSLDDLSS